MTIDILRMQERILQAIERNTEAVLDNTLAVRELLSPPQRVSGTRGIETSEEFSRRGKVTRARK